MATISPRMVGAGAFIVIGGLMFTIALFMIGDRRLLFEDRMTVYTEFASLGQLQTGAIVRVAGMNAGEVTEISIPASPDDKFRVKMEIRKDVHPLLRADSVATPRTEGLVGGIYVAIASGTSQAAVVPEGGTIPGHEPFVLADLLQEASQTIQQVNQTIDALSGNAEHALERIAMTTDEAHQLLVNISPEIQAMAENGNRISVQTEQIVTQLRDGEGTMGKLLNDDSLYQNAQEAASQAKDVMANLKQVSDEARRAIADVRSKDGPAQGLFADMRATLVQTREATADLADNMEAMKHNFFLRGFFNRRGYFDLDTISPAEYRNGVLENGKRKAMRIWLSSSVLFEPGPDNTEVLSAEGRERIDSAMSTYLRYLPTNPLVVEGYSTQGTAGDRYRQSRDRAAIVRQYVLGRYGLMPQHTGYIALGNDTKDSPSAPWEGVSLALFMDTEALQFADQRASK